MSKIPRKVSVALGALKFSGARREQLRALSDSEWTDLLSFCDLTHLTIPLSRACGEHLPGWVRSRIDANVADNTRRFERIKEVYAEFANALRDAGAEHLVMKGFALSPGFVEDPRFRLQSDIDVYCPPESIFRARDALAMIGYEPVRGVDFTLADHLPTMVLNTPWKWHGNYYDPDIPVSFELHFRFWNESLLGFGPRGLDQFWSRRVDRRLDNIGFPALGDVDNLGYTALNLTRSLLRDGASAHQAYELAWFLHTNAENEPFWKRWRQSHDDSLRRLEAISFRLAFHCFACRLPEEVEQEIDRLPIEVKAWCEEFGEFALTAPLQPNKLGLWLELSVLESSADKRSLLRKKLLPTRVPEIERDDLPDTSGDQQTGRRSPPREHAEYLGRVISRVAHRAPSALWHGTRWWWSTKELGREFWNFLAVSFLFDVGMFIFFVLYNLYLLDRGFRENFVGLVVSATAIGSVAGTIPAGLLARRLGLQKTLLLCLTLVSLVSALRSLLATEAALLALAFFGGASSTIWAVSISPAIANLTNEKNRPFAFSLVFSSGIGTGIIGGQMGGRLPGWLARIHPFLTSHGSKQAALLIACGIVALATWPASRLKFASVPVREKRFFPRNQFVFRFLAAIAVWSLVTGAFSPFFNAYFSQYLRMPLERIGVVTSVSQVSQALAVLAAPFIFQKFGVVTGIVYTQIATAVALGCLAAVPGASAAAVVYAGYMALQWMSEPGMYSLLMSRVTPSEQTGASTLNFLVISLAQAIAAAAAGASFVRFGYPAVLSVTAGLALAAAFLFRMLLGKSPWQAVQVHTATSTCEPSESVAGNCFSDSIEG